MASLKERAARKGRALEHELREILTRAARPTRTELAAELARCRAMTPKTYRTAAENTIREIRDKQ